MNKPTIEKTEIFSVSGLTKHHIELILIGFELMHEQCYQEDISALKKLFGRAIDYGV